MGTFSFFLLANAPAQSSEIIQLLCAIARIGTTRMPIPTRKVHTYSVLFTLGAHTYITYVRTFLSLVLDLSLYWNSPEIDKRGCYNLDGFC